MDDADSDAEPDTHRANFIYDGYIPLNKIE